MILTAERVLLDGVPKSGIGLSIDKHGIIRAIGPLEELGQPDVSLAGRLLTPGLVNAHSHAFQRLLRGRTQVAATGEDSFWTWREAMYRVAGRLDPEAVYVAARQMFIELLLSGVTAVGEFHYLHHRPDGTPYPEPAELAEAVVRAGMDAGLRLCLLRVVYLRGDFDQPPSERQRRFVDRSLDEACEAIDVFQKRLLASGSDILAWGVAPHSLRAVPLDAVVAMKTRYGHQPFHLHVSEQPREVELCQKAYGARPVTLLARHGILDAGTTLVHATHIDDDEADAIAKSGTVVCICPSTEADLGDGHAPARALSARGVPVALGTDGQTLSSILGEARRLEMHERLRWGRRNVLSAPGQSTAQRVFEAATGDGGRALGLEIGKLRRGHWADLVSFDLDDPALAGADDDSLLAALVFSTDGRAVRDVIVRGRFVVQDGVHPQAGASGKAFGAVQRRIWSGA